MQEWLYRAKRYYHFFKTGLTGFWAAIRYHHPEKKLKVILVTGTDGKTTTSSLIYHLLKKNGYKVALLSTVAAYIGEEKLDTGFHVTTPSPADLYRYMANMVDAGMEYLVSQIQCALEQQFIPQSDRTDLDFTSPGRIPGIA